MSGTVMLVREGTLAAVTLSNPGKRNALDGAMWRTLADTFRSLSGDDSLRCVVLRGEGESFAAGGDLEEFLSERDTLERAQRYHGEWVAPALDAIAQCLHPTVAEIRGACVGGGLELAACCDLRICGESARFGVPIARLGFSMYPRELAMLLALAGHATALELLLEGRLLDAREACAKGLVTRVVGDADLADEVVATALRIGAGAPLAARAHKQWVRRLTAAAARLTEAELRDSFAFLDSADYREGMDAFLAKRAPRFSGR